MKKKDVIKSKELFTNLIKKSKFVKNSDYVIYYNDNLLDKKRFGIAISNKLGKAHIRNKLKRQTREIIDKTNYLFKNNKDYIIMIRKGCLESSFSDRLKNIEKIIKEIK